MTAAIAATSGLFAKKVKFQVNMTGKMISPNGVHIAGNFQKDAGASDNWKPSETKMTNGGSGDIYSVVVNIPAKNAVVAEEEIIVELTQNEQSITIATEQGDAELVVQEVVELTVDLSGTAEKTQGGEEPDTIQDTSES